jgi:hypothetical protein
MAKKMYKKSTTVDASVPRIPANDRFLYILASNGILNLVWHNIPLTITTEYNTSLNWDNNAVELYLMNKACQKFVSVTLNVDRWPHRDLYWDIVYNRKLSEYGYGDDIPWYMAEKIQSLYNKLVQDSPLSPDTWLPKQVQKLVPWASTDSIAAQIAKSLHPDAIVHSRINYFYADKPYLLRVGHPEGKPLIYRKDFGDSTLLDSITVTEYKDWERQGWEVRVHKNLTHRIYVKEDLDRVLHNIKWDIQKFWIESLHYKSTIHSLYNMALVRNSDTYITAVYILTDRYFSDYDMEEKCIKTGYCPLSFHTNAVSNIIPKEEK